MGNSSQYTDPHKWRVDKQYPYFQLLTNCYGEQVQRHRLHFRIASPSEWVKVISCNNKDNIYYLIIERTLKLYQLKQLSFLECVRILKLSLKAYISLCRGYGRFEVSQGMIGLNNKNQLRMWINQNFASNQPSKLTSVNDKTIINTIVQLIAKHIKERKQEFLNILNPLQQINFMSSINYLQRYYHRLKTNKISLLNSLPKKYSPQKVYRQRKTSQFQCQVNLLQQSVLKQLNINKAKLPIKTELVQQQVQTDRIMFNKQKQTSYCSNSKRLRAKSPELDTYNTLNTQRQMLPKTTNCSDSLMKRVRSESSFMNKIDLFETTDFNGSFNNTLQTKTFPLDLPIVLSLNQVPSREVIIIQQSTIIRGGKQYQNQ